MVQDGRDGSSVGRVARATSRDWGEPAVRDATVPSDSPDSRFPIRPFPPHPRPSSFRPGGQAGPYSRELVSAALPRPPLPRPPRKPDGAMR